ncbi:MAG TPA: hypothetical protein DCY56_06010 [Candidatus Omnitrophica bacterium]|nr:hypothetical protein [Candidatus Omnitrophota bacterium]
MRTKNILFTVAAIFLVFIFAVIALIGLDVMYHQKYIDRAGLNYRGYRGKVSGKKRPSEIRIVMLGGSSLFGYGVQYNQAIPALLEEKLNAQTASKTKKKYSVINLAYNNEGAYAFYFNLQDFAYLDYDYVIIYDGYNDLGVGNVVVYRHNDPVFRMFNYMPILPLIIKEKILCMRYSGNLEDAYRSKKVTFTPTPKDQIKISALENSLKNYSAIENIIKRINKTEKADFDIDVLKNDPWAWYTHYMRKAVDYALSRNKKVIIITQPYISDTHRNQQKSLREMLNKTYAGNSSVAYFDLGDSFHLEDTSFCFDGMHLNIKGCEVMAEYIFERIKELIH